MSKEIATFGAGCFWCVETIFSSLKGVNEVLPGYCGGNKENPTYEEVCEGTTGHAEVCQISFDPEVISYSGLLEVFWKIHDPTTLNRQGEDIGTQYRSIIFYHTEGQKTLAENAKHSLEKAKIWDNTIVTRIEPFNTFFVAEGYHKDYYNNNPSNKYCSLVVTPKVEKFKKVFKELLK